MSRLAEAIALWQVEQFDENGGNTVYEHEWSYDATATRS
jgi:hypothetical protein